MSWNYKNLYQTRKTPQSEPIPGKAMVKGRAGGFVFGLDCWKRLDRFLVLGSSANTYYATARELTRENAEAVAECLKEDGARTVERIVEISLAGRAPKNDPALFALAMAAAADDNETRNLAYAALPKVARIGTHLFHFAEFVQGFRGWGRGLREAFAHWYNDKPADRLAYQLLKYQSRDGWSHRDVLRKAHVNPVDGPHNDLYNWAVNGWEGTILTDPPAHLAQINAFESLKREATSVDVAEAISLYRLTREMVPTEHLKSEVVWSALLDKMPMTAMLRNLGKMTQIGLLKPLSADTDVVCMRLLDPERLAKARVHPLSVLVAMKTYEQGHGFRGSLSWDPITGIVDALDEAFYLSFQNVEPAGKRMMLALDVSGSMSNGEVAGMTGVTPRAGSAAMAMVALRTEDKVFTTAFSCAGEGAMAKKGRSRWGYGGKDGISVLPLSKRQRLDDVVALTDGMPFGGTDCALPMLYALEKGWDVDAFLIYTDSETWANPEMHPCQAVQLYREKTGIDAKLVVVGMTSNGFSISDPTDPGMLDVVGYSTATPNTISGFVRGEI